VSITEAPATVRIGVSDQAFIASLTIYLESAECRVRKVGQVTLDVSMPRAPSDDQALREMAIYLRAWQAMHPSVHAHIMGEGETR
jgi:hypothetical protein